MNKQEYLSALRVELFGLPQADIEDRLAFYSEMIDDRIEEGLTEEEAIAAVGSAQEIASQIVADIPLSKIAKERIKPRRRLKSWEIVLLVLGSPIWLSLGISVFAVIISLYVSLWSVIVSIWATFVSFAAWTLVSTVAGLGIIFTVEAGTLIGTATLGAGLVFAGLSIFMFYGCKAATKGILLLTNKIALWIKNCFRGKEIA